MKIGKRASRKSFLGTLFQSRERTPQRRAEVRRLRRYQIGALRLKGIPLRGVKQLSNKEISSLFAVPRSHPRDATAPAHDED